MKERQFHGKNKRYAYFEGWYLKHQNAEEMIALIPAFHVDREGKRSASIQVITRESAYHVPFNADVFQADIHAFRVNVGKNYFSSNGMTVDLAKDGLEMRGRLEYSPFHPPKRDMMGPFRFLPFMQCNHGVVSFSHQVEGELTVNGRKMRFNKGRGYIEKDWGRSFPRRYLWTQGGDLAGEHCVMLAIADIPMAGFHFPGCLCSVYHHGKEYRLATYGGVKIEKYTPREVILTQSVYRVQVTLLEAAAHCLRAPEKGAMTRTIHESPACTVRYRFWDHGETVLDFTEKQAGFEYVGDTYQPFQ